MRRTYRYRLYPTQAQAGALERQLGEACDLYNAALQHRRDSWREHGRRVTFYDQCAELKDCRAEGILDKTANAWSQQAVLRRLDRAFQSFFRRVKSREAPGYPRFRSRRRYATLDFTFGSGGGIAITDAGRLRIQNVGHVKIRTHRSLPPEAKLCEARITRRHGRWYASLSLSGVAPRPLRKTNQSVGIDLGITTFAALSDGELIAGPRAGRAGSKSVRRAQRKVSRRKRGSYRRQKAVILLARQREKEANVRRDYAHKLARRLVQRYDTIAVENLNLRGLARGMLARDVHDQGWGAFVALLAEKAEDAARELVLVDAKGTSQTCSECGVIVRKKLSDRTHSCTCGYVENRDVNAARNVLARAIGPDGAVRRERWGEEARAVA